jgi:DNA-binding NarL/FixJ family response regulator
VNEIKIVLVDDKEIFREGLTKILQEQDSIGTVYQCTSTDNALARIKQTKPNLVLISNSISGGDSTELVSQIIGIHPDIKVAIITASGDKEDLYEAIEVGVTGYLTKSMKLKDLLKSIDLIAEGQVVISPELSSTFVDKFSQLRSAEGGIESELSERELDVLRLVAIGATNKEIAAKMYITENTAKVHVKNILAKLELKNRQQAAAYAVQQGLISEVIDIEEDENFQHQS